LVAVAVPLVAVAVAVPLIAVAAVPLVAVAVAIPASLAPGAEEGKKKEKKGAQAEGIFILAALASGFTMRQPGRLPTATFNISERSLKKRAKDFAKQYAQRDSYL